MNSDILFLSLATFGALSQEIVHWYELRNKFEDEETKRLFTSKYYWMITIFMIIVSGVGTYLLFHESSFDKKTPFFLGAAFPLLFKKLSKVAEARHLGNNRSISEHLTFEKVSKAYFR